MKIRKEKIPQRKARDSTEGRKEIFHSAAPRASSGFSLWLKKIIFIYLALGL